MHRASVVGSWSRPQIPLTKWDNEARIATQTSFFHGKSLFGSAVLFMGTVGGLASLARPEPLRIRLGSFLSKEIIATIFSLPRRSTFSSRQVCFLSFFSHRDERLRQHGVAATSSSPGRTDDSAILGQLRNRSADQLTFSQIQYSEHFFNRLIVI